MWHVSAVPIEWTINPNPRLSADELHFVLLLLECLFKNARNASVIGDPRSLASNWLEIYFSLLYSVTKITHRPNKLEPVVLCQVCLALFDISLCLFCSTGVIANSMTFVKMTKLFPSYVSGSLYWINNNI